MARERASSRSRLPGPRYVSLERAPGVWHRANSHGKRGALQGAATHKNGPPHFYCSTSRTSKVGSASPLLGASEISNPSVAARIDSANFGASDVS